MSYKVLARKCRPQTFQEVIGQTHITRTLVNALRDGRIAHGFLFTGERGVGKTSVARILAKALNCHQGLTEHPCGACPSCIEIAAGGSLDVHEIDGASNTGVDDIRALRENVRYMPSRDRYKVYIIDEVHMLSASAFNALLKTLEEPPPHVVFIFATTEPQKIPDTIISRCLRFDFRRIPLQDIIGHLEHIAQQEQITVSPQGLYLIAREAEGSMRDAQTILERAISYCGAAIRDADLQEMLGHIDRRLLYRVMEGIIAGDPQRCIDGLTRVYEYGIDLRQFYYGFLELLRDMMMVKTVADHAKVLEASDEDVRMLRELAGGLSPEGLLRCFRLWFSAEPDITRSLLPKTALEVCLLEMLHAKEAAPVDEILSRIEALQRQLQAAAPERPAPLPRPAQLRPEPSARAVPEAQKPEQTSAAPAGDGSVDALRAFIGRQHAQLASYLQHAQITISAEGRVTVEFPAGDFFMERFKEPETEQKLRELCQSFLQRSVQLVIQAGREKKNGSEQETREDLKKKREQQVLHNPVIQNVLKTFNGKIVTIRTDG
jgi:DNA polymerase-3 subunit gamma/tau